MTPQEIVHELDKHIIGQARAKRAVAIALRNRWRRQQVAEPLRQEITPKNILMIGPTGVGKTEIARRLARLADAPFIKVEATKFTEVGYVGRDVDTIIRDLVEISDQADTREAAMQKVRRRAEDAAEERVLDALLPGPREASGLRGARRCGRSRTMSRRRGRNSARCCAKASSTTRRSRSRSRRRRRKWKSSPRRAWRSSPSRSRACSRIWAAAGRSAQAEDPRRGEASHRRGSARLVNDEDLKAQALANVEQNGIVFLDEIDKITSRAEMAGADVSRQGVQRDLLPLVEGTTVSTKYGMVKTDHILFIASGAFHLSKPSDLIPELQGRFPIRVELDSLSVDDFEQILTATDACLHPPVRSAAGDRSRGTRLQSGRHPAPGRDRLRSTKKPRTSARAGCIR